MIEIAQLSVAEIEATAGFPELLEEYANEVALSGLPHPKAKMQLYYNMEANGVLRVLAAFHETAIVGFIALIISELPHYGKQFAISESFFVARNKRHTGAGLKLLREAERLVDISGSPGFFVSAPFGGALADVLPHVGYAETNRVFCKRFPNAG